MVLTAGAACSRQMPTAAEATAPDPLAEDAQNVRLVGHHDLQGRTALVVTTKSDPANGNWVYVGHHDAFRDDQPLLNPITGKMEFNGTSILETSDPSKPRLVWHIPNETNRNSRGVFVVYDYQHDGSGRDYLIRNSEALTRGDKAAGEEVALRDGEVDRLQWMVAKHYSLAHRSLGGAGWPAAGMHHALLAARALERMADHAARIALLAGKVDDLTEPQRESLRQGTVRVVEVLDAAVAALFSGDVRAANHTIDTAIGVVASVDALRRRPSSHRGGLGETLALAVESLSRTAAYAADLAEIAINQAIEREAPPTPPAPVARTAAREAPRGRGHDAR